MPACPPSRGETSATFWGVGSRHASPSPTEHHERRCVMGDGPHAVMSSAPYDRETEDTMPVRGAGTPTHKEWGPQLTCRTVSNDVNTVLLQHTPNLLDIIHIHAGNTNATVDIAVTVLNDLDLKRDTVQTENDFPAQ